MSVRRKYLVFLIVLVTISGVLIYQNCTGYHERSIDYSVSLDQVNSYLDETACAVQSNSDAATQNAVNLVNTIEGEDGFDLFFTLSPDMGNIGIIAPLDYVSLRTDGNSTPQTLYGFFAIGPDGTGSLVLSMSDASPGSAAATAVSTAVAATQIKRLKKKLTQSFPKNHILASTGTQSCTASNPLNLSTVVAAYNDGSQGLEPATYDGNIFEMELSLDGTSTLRVRSYDVDEGALQGVIQLEVYLIDPDTGAENYLGDINMTQPNS